MGLDYNNRTHKQYALMGSSLDPERGIWHQICPVLVMFLKSPERRFPTIAFPLFTQTSARVSFPIFSSI